MDEMIRAPLRTEVVELPLLEHVEEREVVALGNEELLPRRVGFFLTVLRTRRRTVRGTVPRSEREKRWDLLFSPHHSGRGKSNAPPAATPCTQRRQDETNRSGDACTSCARGGRRLRHLDQTHEATHETWDGASDELLMTEHLKRATRHLDSPQTKRNTHSDRMKLQ